MRTPDATPYQPLVLLPAAQHREQGREEHADEHAGGQREIERKNAAADDDIAREAPERHTEPPHRAGGGDGQASHDQQFRHDAGENKFRDPTENASPIAIAARDGV